MLRSFNTARQRWIHTHRIGVAAFGLAHSSLRHSVFWEEKLLELLEQYGGPQAGAMATLSPIVQSLLSKAFRDVSPEDAAGTDPLQPYSAALKHAMSLMSPHVGEGTLSTELKRGAISPRLSALAHVLAEANSEGYWAVRVARYLFPEIGSSSLRTGSQRTWKSIGLNDALLLELDGALRVYRDPLVASDSRLAAVETVARCIDGVPYCELIENELFDRVCAWPLVVVKSEMAENAIAFPILVDVEFQPRGTMNRSTDLQPQIIGADGIFCDDVDDVSPTTAPHDKMPRTSFFGQLFEAQQAAKDLWRSSLNSYGDYRDAVETSRAIFDFSVAGEIARGIFRPPIELSGPSAGAYFCQAFLMRLLGRRSFLGSAITGGIGKPIVAKDGSVRLDREFLHVGSLPAKLRWHFDTRKGTRFVLPGVSEDPENRFVDEAASAFWQLSNEEKASDGHGSHQNCEVVRPFRLSRVADIVQESPWRKKAYVRCPEIAWALHDYVAREERGGVLSPADRRISLFLTKIWNNHEAVVTVDRAGARTVASALTFIDRDVRVGDSDFVNTFPKPALFWHFIRVGDPSFGPLDDDTEFWRIICRLSGVPENEFNIFASITTRAEALEWLISCFNRTESSSDRPSNRAADIIVLLGTKWAKESWESGNRSPTARPHALYPLLTELNERGLGISEERRRCSRLSEALGKVRIIAVEEELCDEVERQEMPHWGLEPKDWKVLRPLSTFRWEFTQSMASMMLRGELGIPGSQIKQTLNDLQARDALRLFNGHYHIPSELKRQVAETDHDRKIFSRTTDPTPVARDAQAGGVQHQLRDHITQNGSSVTKKLLLLADRQWNAALALAPYAAATEVPSIGYQDAFVPEFVQEAGFHLENAFRLYDSMTVTDEVVFARRDEFRTPVRESLQRLTRAALTPCRGIVRKLMRGKTQDALQDARYVVMQVIGRSEGDKRPPHPRDLLDAAIIYSKRDGCTFEEADALFQRATDSAEEYSNSPAETGYGLTTDILIMSARANFYWKNRRFGSAETLDQKIWERKRSWKTIPGDWIERKGDNAAQRCTSAEIYALGIQYAPDWHQLAFKAIGASLVNGRRLESLKPPTTSLIDAWLERMSSDPIAANEACVKAITACERDAQRRDLDEQRRRLIGSYWREAGSFLQFFWASKEWPAYQTLNWLVNKRILWALPPQRASTFRRVV
jgi:hypothetical protein